jgi:hypothetical protein
MAEKDILITLVDAVQRRSRQLTDVAMDSQRMTGFMQGFDAGVAEGERRAQRKIRQSLGVDMMDELSGNTYAHEAYVAWEKDNQRID